MLAWEYAPYPEVDEVNFQEQINVDILHNSKPSTRREVTDSFDHRCHTVVFALLVW